MWHLLYNASTNFNYLWQSFFLSERRRHSPSTLLIKVMSTCLCIALVLCHKCNFTLYIRFIHNVNRQSGIDGDSSKYSQQGQCALLMKDPMNTAWVNTALEIVQKANTSALEDYVHVYISERNWNLIETNDELFMSFGKHFWCEKQNWESLSIHHQNCAMDVYDINQLKDLIN